jgi:hypothetical protein
MIIRDLRPPWSTNASFPLTVVVGLGHEQAVVVSPHRVPHASVENLFQHLNNKFDIIKTFCNAI